jgi:hypothetical protein
MRILRAMVLSGAALASLAGLAMADGTVDVDKLAAQAAPVLPTGSQWLTISKTAQPEIPGLPLSTKEKSRMGPNATTIRILPATDAPADGAVSWSGYTRAGVVYHGSN